MAQTVHDVLVAARAKIDTPEKWTQGAAARTVTGKKTEPYKASAVCFCGYGAVWSISAEDGVGAEMALDRECGDLFPSWQDALGRTHAEVLAVFDKAIANSAPAKVVA